MEWEMLERQMLRSRDFIHSRAIAIRLNASETHPPERSS